MTDAVNRFYNSIENVSELKQREVIDYFVYFLTIELGEISATAQKIRECFDACDLPIPARLNTHLSESTKKKPPTLIKKNNGYILERHYREKLSSQLGGEKVILQTSAELRKLETQLHDSDKKEFLKETVDCFEAKANRAAIVMCWILTIDHLCEYILKKKLNEFNLALKKQNDKRIKVDSIACRDDFDDIPEGKFIEICRSSKIISNDVRKILDQKLGTRNSCAHPSGVSIKRSKVIDFIDDLVTNVVLKYEI